MSVMLKISNLEKKYISKSYVVNAIKNISYNIEKGEFIGIMGPSGAGKTTLLNVVSTIDKATSGKIEIDGIDITTMKSKELSKFRGENLGFIFQDHNLLDTLTVYENIALPLTIKRLNVKVIDKKIIDVCNLLDITDILNKFPYEISGGQQQRVSTARALVIDPKLILADEPTGSLDSKNAQNILEMFTNLNKNLNSTIMMVTHDPLSASYSNRILFIKDGNIFTEISKGNVSRTEFHKKILDVLKVLGGDSSVL